MDHLIDYLLYALAAVLLFFILFSGTVAYAGMIDTERALASEQAVQERERAKALLNRQDVAKQMQSMGVSPRDVQGRIDAMNDREIRVLAGKLNSLPAAGAAISNNDLIIIILLIVLLVLVV